MDVYTLKEIADRPCGVQIVARGHGYSVYMIVNKHHGTSLVAKSRFKHKAFVYIRGRKRA